MHRLTGPLLMFLALAITTSAQFGKSVSVAAGTPEDKPLAEIYAAPDGPDKIALLDKFMADYGKGDLALLGDQLYVQSYLTQKNYAKVYEYGDKALALDPTTSPPPSAWSTQPTSRVTPTKYSTKAKKSPPSSHATKPRPRPKVSQRTAGPRKRSHAEKRRGRHQLRAIRHGERRLQDG